MQEEYNNEGAHFSRHTYSMCMYAYVHTEPKLKQYKIWIPQIIEVI